MTESRSEIFSGVFFYGIHQVDMLLRLAGYDAVDAAVHQGRNGTHIATVSFASGTMGVMNLVRDGQPAFHVTVIGEKGRLDEMIVNDDNSYLSGIQEFIDLFKMGTVMETDVSILGPVAVLQALEQAIEIGAAVQIDGSFRV